MAVEKTGVFMDIIISGDLFPTSINHKVFSSGLTHELLSYDLNGIWNQADERICNLEGPLVDAAYPIIKNGPNLIAPTDTIIGIKALNISLITLANNHILDQGDIGLFSTISIIEKNGISYVGAGADIAQSSKAHIFEKDGIRIGVYACAEHEFTIASENTAGANPFDPLESLDHIQSLKSKCNYVVVLHHGGKEHYRYPSPKLQRVTRKMVNKGADVVVCQHSHCVGCYEKYQNGTIIYGQGNFIFNKYDNEYWNNGLLIKLHFGDKVSVDYIPIIKTKIGAKLAIGDEADAILEGFFTRSKEIINRNVLEERYTEFAKLHLVYYLRNISGFGKLINWLDKHCLGDQLQKWRYSKAKLLAIQNYIECEAHSELLVNGISDYITNNEKPKEKRIP